MSDASIPAPWPPVTQAEAGAPHPSNLPAWLMPSFREQRQMFETLRSLLRQALLDTGAVEPTEAVLDGLVEKQFVELGRQFGSDFCRRLAIAPVTAVGTAPMAMPPPAAESASTDEQRRMDDAQAAVWYARLHGIPSLPDALAWFLAHRKKTAQAPPIRRCVEEFLIAKRLAGRAPLTLNVYRRRLEQFAAEFGDRLPTSVKPGELGTYFARWREPGTVGGHWDILSVFFNWMVVKSYAFENPVPLALKRPTGREAARLIYTPDEARRILREVKYTDQIGFWSLSLFAGLRGHEIQRLNALPHPWDIIQLKRGVIDLSGTPVVSGRRVIPILPVLHAWLTWVRARRVPFYPSNHWEKFRMVRAIAIGHRYSNPAEAAAGRQGRSIQGKAVYAVARRSYVSYRLALDGASYVEISDEVGNSEQFLRTHFYRKASTAEAKRYFALTPAAVERNGLRKG